MKLIVVNLVVTLLLLSCLTFGQASAPVAIPGTKCSMVPPPGFLPATNFSGFYQESTGASIMIVEMPGSSEELSKAFTAEALKAKGMIMVEKEKIDFNNQKGTLIRVSQSANGNVYLKQLLLFGDSSNTVLLNGIYPESSKYLEPEIRKALLSTIYNVNQAENALDAVSFTLDVSGTNFILAKFISGSLIYTTDGKIPSDKPTIIISASLGRVPEDNRKQYTLERFKKLPRGEFNTVKEIQPVTVDGLPGFEITGSGKNKSGQDQLLYQTMLFTDDGNYFIILGMAGEEMPDNLQRFKSVTRTFKRK